MAFFQDAIAAQVFAPKDPSDAWPSRVRPAAYTSPKTKTRIAFGYEAVSREVDARNTPFAFAGINDAYLQPNGFSARRYPMRCYFSGNYHDKEATAFEAALLEPGRGRLEHPFYGTFDVVPSGTITRRDDLVRESNQSVVEVTFWTSTEAVYPSDSVDPKNEILAALDAMKAVGASKLAAKANLKSAVSKASFKTTVQDFLKTVESYGREVSSTNSAINREFYDAQRLINNGIDVLIGQPLQLSQQVFNLVTAPGRATLGLVSRLEMYRAFAGRLLSSAKASGSQAVPGIPATSVRRASALLREKNDFHAADLFASAAIAGSATAALETVYTTRPEAIQAAAAVTELYDQVVAWRDSRMDALEETDDGGGAFQSMQRLIGTISGYLVQTSFTLATERRVVLDRPRTIIDLSGELYGSVDDRLDFLINTNRLTGSEILELPRGRVIVYYT